MRYRESEEMYLETIFLLTKQKPCVHSIDIATELNYSRASVSRAANLLQKKGYISISPSGEITFTDNGTEKARSIYERHSIITKVLTKLGANEEIAEDNACRFEHVITQDLLKVMEEYLQKNK
jgi:Mn-dependent DtxR family transcriptional regulator